ncbi:VWA domain-containing protein [Faecalibacillus intestinalis]|uniref:VWA domain-containing protein n=1 Tax=Faecalibacillus intestinalis TaxID=1982626 RepID=A0AAP2UGP6_9FIRM|nr:vWA domain-containing protein [Faecalibacillus intestinalis]MCB8592704.1 VWA domain-containing protein [Faecalibacillus intestinalis]MCB8613935.1 VWA domain-containing protein [Faecalibacillus intestinalis]MCG4682429.1 VWA domain-containing protein [Faecalibacillus intestinalis]MCG4715368.1 VWA domain-containing protein [Faecalibacillus intestinalis]MCG4756577.1 VWA domain-containing protein [Faecalibacillus intestinalis]
MKIYKKVIACILTLMMFFAQMPVNVFAANQKNNIPLDIVLVLDVSGSMEDPITSTDTTKRITILKDSINQFIEGFAENNSKINQANKQSRISIIKFSGDKSDKVGNETYKNSQFIYNYTQVMSNFFTVTNENKAKLEDVVNSISPAGATRSDYAMELALKQIEQSKNDESRKYAKRIVFFVTDGQPTTLSNFDDDVANKAITTSKKIKKDAEVYTFGMFSLTDPSITGHVGSGSWSDAEKFNAYMHGVSSNYPDAQSYKDLGTRAENSAYYMGAKSSNEAKAIFNSVLNKLLSMTYAGADYTKVTEAKKRIPSDLTLYTDETVQALEDVLKDVKYDLDITQQDTVDGYADAINEAINQLKYKAADYTEVDKAIEKANKLNKDNYKDFSKVEDAIKTVVRSKNITEQDDVDAMAKAINDAIDALVFQLKIKYGSNGGTGTMANPTVELDKEFIFQKCEYVAPNGKHFKGWQVDNTVYKVGDKRVFTKDDQNKEIKAVWEEHTFDQKLKEVNGVSTLKDKATCTTNAIYYKSCACGQVSTTETFEDKDTKLGHEYTKQIKDAKYLKSQGSNCQEHDAYWYACSRCDVSAKDDENAQDKYYESAEVGNHVLSKDWNKDSNNHWHSCTVPGCNEVSDKGNHVYDQEVESSEYLATPATCMTPARYYKSCICGAKGTEAFAATGTHLGHAYIEVKNPQFLREKATNCKEHDTYWYVCSRCGKTSKTINKYYEDKDSKGEHISSDWIIDQQPTVAKEGSKHKECTVCKEVLETEKIAKLENVKTETKKEETASKKEIKVESKKAVTTGDNTNSIVPMVLLGISLLGIYMIVMKKYVR